MIQPALYTKQSPQIAYTAAYCDHTVPPQDIVPPSTTVPYAGKQETEGSTSKELAEEGYSADALERVTAVQQIRRGY